MQLPEVAIDASRALGTDRTGTENYSYHLIRALVSHNRQATFTLYGKVDSLEWQNEVVNTHYSQIEWTRLWTQGGLALKMWSNRPDLLFVPAHVLPFLKPLNLKTVVTVHDLRSEFLPQHRSILQKFYLNQSIEKARANAATHLIAVSESTKRDIHDRLGVDDNKITVVYEGYDKEFFNGDVQNQTAKINEVKERLQLHRPYILFVGTIQPRKNLVRLIEAFAELQRGFGDLDIVLAGTKGWLSEEIYAAPGKFKVQDRVKFLNFVLNQDLPYLYAGAELFAFPSLYEGFGIPVLESLAVGTPVVTSKIASLPEVGGDVVTYVDPLNIESIVEGLKKGLDSDLDTIKVEQQLAKFSWEKAADETMAVFNKVLSHE